MEELDPIIRDLGNYALKTKESCSRTSNFHTHTLKYRHMGLLLVLTLVLMFISQGTFLLLKIPSIMLAITVNLPLVNYFVKKRTK